MAWATPAGPVTDEFFDHFTDALATGCKLARADGVLLALHGAMVTPKHPDADAETLRRVRAALAKLPRRQAVALVLRHSGLSYADVAAALDLSPGSVGTTVRRAESALREELSTHAFAD